MSLLSHYSDTLAPQQLETLLKEAPTGLSALRSRDELLLAELATKNDGQFVEQVGFRFANDELARLAQPAYDASDLSRLETFLNQKGTLDIPVVTGYSVSVDGTERNVAIVAATDIAADTSNHGDMSSMLYLRDHVQAASALIELNLQNPDQYASEGETGHTLLLSALHLMSTPAQLARFEGVIKRGSAAGQADWPHISLRFNDMNAAGPNGWRNKQDTFQMLAYLTLDAVERGFLQIDELADAHKQFLGSIVPLLNAVGFPTYENSGSWEEIAANRTSVMAVETALLHKIKTLIGGEAFDFLQETYDQIAGETSDNFETTLDTMLKNGLQEIGRRLPDESPDYDRHSITFRGADAALTYVLMYGLPKLLADAEVPIAAGGNIAMSRGEIEALVLEQLATLLDPVTGGITRYEEDSYQRVNFHTNEVQWVIRAIKRKVQKDAMQTDGEIDLDKKQALRGELMPQGRTAAWTHPLGQLSAWAASRSLECVHEGALQEARQYRELSTSFLNRALSTVTGRDQWHATLGEDGYYHTRHVPAYKLPECLVTYKQASQMPFEVPSPHTPLNWSSAMLKQAIGLLYVGGQSFEKK